MFREFESHRFRQFLTSDLTLATEEVQDTRKKRVGDLGR